jgi:hypothetical protein
VTRHEYDDDGRLVASFTSTEAEWDALGYAEMQALAIYEASLCPGCKRPVDICAADFEQGAAYVVESHICTTARAVEIQRRVEAWENTDRDQRAGSMPVDAVYSDGRFHAPRPARPDELTID